MCSGPCKMTGGHKCRDCEFDDQLESEYQKAMSALGEGSGGALRGKSEGPPDRCKPGQTSRETGCSYLVRKKYKTKRRKSYCSACNGSCKHEDEAVKLSEKIRDLDSEVKMIRDTLANRERMERVAVHAKSLARWFGAADDVDSDYSSNFSGAEERQLQSRIQEIVQERQKSLSLLCSICPTAPECQTGCNLR